MSQPAQRTASASQRRAKNESRQVRPEARVGARGLQAAPARRGRHTAPHFYVVDSRAATYFCFLPSSVIVLATFTVGHPAAGDYEESQDHPASWGKDPLM